MKGAILKEFAAQPKQPKVWTMTAQINLSCMCGNEAPLTLLYVPGMIVEATCGSCRRKYAVNSFVWKRGMGHPDVELAIAQPDIVIPQLSNVPQG